MENGKWVDDELYRTLGDGKCRFRAPVPMPDANISIASPEEAAQYAQKESIDSTAAQPHGVLDAVDTCNPSPITSTTRPFTPQAAHHSSSPGPKIKTITAISTSNTRLNTTTNTTHLSILILLVLFVQAHLCYQARLEWAERLKN